MRRIAIISVALVLVTALSACSGSSSSVQRSDRFSGMTFSMPIGSTFK